MQNRRQFLKTSLALPALAGSGSLLGTLASLPANAMDTSGYRALVCVFLYGGMDCHDTLLPFDTPSYNSYAQLRSTLLQAYAANPGGSSRARDALLPLEPASAQFSGRQFALPPQMSALHTLFDQGNAAIVGNVGPLLEPTNRSGYLNESANLPARLFSHNDQQSTWMSFAPEGAQLGWGGRFGDAASQAGANSSGVFSQVALSGNPVFLAGENVTSLQVGIDGVPKIYVMDTDDSAFNASLREHFIDAGVVRSGLFEQDYVAKTRTSLAANEALEAALSRGARLDTVFPNTSLAAQLSAVAQAISVRDELGASRQVFFVSMGGFDTHSAQANDLPGLQQVLSDAIGAFYQATQELGLEDSITTFTAADFGRTLTVNGDGTDHGWGSHHFVVGGAVNGGDIYGAVPVAELGHAQDAGNGRLIPQIAVEQYAAPLGRWFGLSDSELAVALPHLSTFGDPMLNVI